MQCERGLSVKIQSHFNRINSTQLSADPGFITLLLVTKNGIGNNGTIESFETIAPYMEVIPPLPGMSGVNILKTFHITFPFLSHNAITVIFMLIHMQDLIAFT